MEMMGVALIVVIIVIGMFFVLFSKKTDVDSKEDILDSQLSQGLLNAMLSSETACGNDFSEVVKDCYGRNTLCKDSCMYIHEKAAEVFNGTLEKWGKPYRFYTERKGDRKIILEKKCTQFSEKSSIGIAMINYRSDVIVVTLEICKA